jgi:5-(carboxyamino)imidazole ribonucleotide synthase
MHETYDATGPAGEPAIAPRLGIIGGGQLARMTAMTALKLGCDVVVLERNAVSPAATLATHSLVGDWDDPTVLTAFAAQCDVVTFENEFVDAAALAALQRAGRLVFPRAESLALVQDKYVQKKTLEEAGLPVVPYERTATVDALHAALRRLGVPAVLKARRDAYDGRGNSTIRAHADAEPAWRQLSDDGRRALFVEQWCDFTMELAVMVTRGRDGTTVAYPVVETEQRDHVCRVVRAPARVTPAVAAQVTEYATRAAAALDAVGTIGVECFLTTDGRVLINEVAPRVHNSGHYTIEACACSQFENHVRAVLGLPLGSPRLVAPAAVMVNLLGASRVPARPAGLDRALAVPGASLHLYGKRMSGERRKLGHVTALGESLAEAEAAAMRCAESITFGGVA